MTRRRSARLPRNDSNGQNTDPAGQPQTSPSPANGVNPPIQYVTPSHGRGALMRPWEPGQSGNPGGRPKLIQSVRARFFEMIQRRTFDDLEDLLQNGEDAVRIQAHRLLLEYALGRPSSIPLGLLLTDPAKEVQVEAQRNDTQLLRAREDARAERDAAQRAEVERRDAELVARVTAEEREQAAQIRRSVRAAKQRAKRKAAQASPATVAPVPPIPSPREAGVSGAGTAVNDAGDGRAGYVTVEEVHRREDERRGRSHLMGPRDFGPP